MNKTNIQNTLILILMTFSLLFYNEDLSSSEPSHIYIDQLNGNNNSSTLGTETDPFKSITYAMLTMNSRGTPDPWIVHIKAGTYDNNPVKPANERELFPIELRQGITV